MTKLHIACMVLIAVDGSMVSVPVGAFDDAADARAVVQERCQKLEAALARRIEGTDLTVSKFLLALGLSSFSGQVLDMAVHTKSVILRPS